MACPHKIAGCICTRPGANPKAHGQPPKPCRVCGGETGLHRMGCPELDTRIVGYDLDDEAFAQLIAPDADEGGKS